ncbi:MAG: hypothetical protein ISR65_03425 [Bacteriovoracaceae bacterium]|nr:hypothetical protein [Bacteriovoracaceae bacterium]
MDDFSEQLDRYWGRIFNRKKGSDLLAGDSRPNDKYGGDNDVGIGSIFILILTLGIPILAVALIAISWSSKNLQERIKYIADNIFDKIDDDAALKKGLIDIFGSEKKMKDVINKIVTKYFSDPDNKDWHPVSGDDRLAFEKYLKLELIKEISNLKLSEKLKIPSDHDIVLASVKQMTKAAKKCINDSNSSQGITNCQVLYQRSSLLRGGREILKVNLNENLAPVLENRYQDLEDVAVIHYDSCAQRDYLAHHDRVEAQIARLRDQSIARAFLEHTGEERVPTHSIMDMEYSRIIEAAKKKFNEEQALEIRKKFDAQGEQIINACALESMYRGIEGTLASKLLQGLGEFLSGAAKIKKVNGLLKDFSYCVKHVGKKQGSSFINAANIPALLDLKKLKKLTPDEFKAVVEPCVDETIKDAGKEAFSLGVRANKALNDALYGVVLTQKDKRNGKYVTAMQRVEDIVLRDGYDHCIELYTNKDPTRCMGYANVVGTKEALAINLRMQMNEFALPPYRANIRKIDKKVTRAVDGCFGNIKRQMDDKVSAYNVQYRKYLQAKKQRKKVVEPVEDKFSEKQLGDKLLDCQILGITEYAGHVTGIKVEAEIKAMGESLEILKRLDRLKRKKIGHHLNEIKKVGSACFQKELNKDRGNKDLFSEESMSAITGRCELEVKRYATPLIADAFLRTKHTEALRDALAGIVDVEQKKKLKKKWHRSLAKLRQKLLRTLKANIKSVKFRANKRAGKQLNDYLAKFKVDATVKTVELVASFSVSRYLPPVDGKANPDYLLVMEQVRQNELSRLKKGIRHTIDQERQIDSTIGEAVSDEQLQRRRQKAQKELSRKQDVLIAGFSLEVTKRVVPKVAMQKLNTQHGKALRDAFSDLDATKMPESKKKALKLLWEKDLVKLREDLVAKLNAKLQQIKAGSSKDTDKKIAKLIKEFQIEATTKTVDLMASHQIAIYYPPKKDGTPDKSFLLIMKKLRKKALVELQAGVEQLVSKEQALDEDYKNRKIKTKEYDAAKVKIAKKQDRLIRQFSLSAAKQVGNQQISDVINEQLPFDPKHPFAASLTRTRSKIKRGTYRQFKKCIDSKTPTAILASNVINYCKNSITKSMLTDLFMTQLKFNMNDILLNTGSTTLTLLFKSLSLTPEKLKKPLQATKATLRHCLNFRIDLQADKEDEATNKGMACAIMSTFDFVEHIVRMVRLENLKKGFLLEFTKSSVLGTDFSAGTIVKRLQNCVAKVKRKNNLSRTRHTDAQNIQFDFKKIKTQVASDPKLMDKVTDGISECISNWDKYVLGNVGL